MKRFSILLFLFVIEMAVYFGLVNTGYHYIPFHLLFPLLKQFIE